MAFLGERYIDGTATFYAQTFDPTTGGVADSTSAPTWSVYEDETDTAIQTGTMTKLDDAGTTGFYSEQLTLSAVSGYEVDKDYCVRLVAANGSVTGAALWTFVVRADPVVATDIVSAGAITTSAGAVSTVAAVTGAVGSVAGNVDGTVRPAILKTTIDTLSSQTVFALVAGSADDDAYNGMLCIITDQSTATQKAIGRISDYTGSITRVSLTDTPVFTIAPGDIVEIVPVAMVAAALATYDGPTNAEMEARTILATDYFDPATDAVANVTLVDTTTTNTDMLTAAAVNAEVDTALADYDGPTKAEMDSGFSGQNDVSTAEVNAQCDLAISDAALATAAALATVDGNVDLILADTGTDGVVLSAATIQSIADGLLDRTDGVEPGSAGTERTVREALRIILSACGGKASGLATATAVYRDTNDTKDRITATVDADGNRSAVTLIDT